ncbi:MAG TPA: hypothetical protein VFV78_08555 [Vicinamibacterales bacterium]|nr:hypothetical protein [Vicinamibacterales bacterium]
MRVQAWLEAASDRLSPLVVKEARQVVRSREFVFSFLASLVAGLLIAFVGATDALAGSSTAGQWTFNVLLGCLALLGLAVVPLAAFTTLRQERVEQTLELITLTSLSSRRIIVGKLLAQSVKLLTLFAAVAPFLTMSFLLGGIDLTTIAIGLVAVYMASLWAGAFCLFLSTLFRSRAASGLAFSMFGLFVLLVLFLGFNIIRMVSLGFFPGIFGLGIGIGSATGPSILKVLLVAATFWTISLVNLVLLAENRLSLATEDSVTPLRVGFFVQFALMAGWSILWWATTARIGIFDTLGTFGLVHLAAVAVFTLTEEMRVPRRVLVRQRVLYGSRLLGTLFGPGAGRAAIYLLMQMAILVIVCVLFSAAPFNWHRVLASLGYVCFFTGVPVLAFWSWAPAKVTPMRLRVAILVTVAATMVLPDVVYHLIAQPETLDLRFSTRHLINPFRTFAEWDVAEGSGWTVVPAFIGVTGLAAYIQIIVLGVVTAPKAVALPARAESPEGAAGRGDVLD